VRAWPAAAAWAATVAATAGACGGSGDAVRCAVAGKAQVCVGVPGGGGDGTLDAQGFQPGSTVVVRSPSGDVRSLPVGAGGRLAGGVFAFLPGPDEEQHRIEGTDGAGEGVAFVIRCSTPKGCVPEAARS